MKKLMIAAAIVCAAVVSQAAGFNWQLSPMEYMETPEFYYTGTGFLFADGQQQAVLDAFFAGQDITSLALEGSALSIFEGETSKTSDTIQWGNAGDSKTAFFAALLTEGDKDYVFISDSMTKDNPGTGAATFAFLTEKASTTVLESTTFSSAAYYTSPATPTPPTPVTPEPTSGLLLLIGVAGLALRRRRA